MNERDQLLTISRIAKAGVPILKELGAEEATVLSLMMDIEHVHGIGQLDLERFLEAAETSRQDFAHDIVGIYRHFNRQTLQLEGCFEPRFTDYSAA